MTKPKSKTAFSLLGTSALALMLHATPAAAVDQAVIDGIVADLSAQGFSRIEIEIARSGIDVDAYGAGFEGDFEYRRDGTLVRADIDDDDDDEDDDRYDWRDDRDDDADDGTVT